MTYPEQRQGAESTQRISSVLAHLRQSKDVTAELGEVVDVAMEMTGADMGTLQRFDEENDWLEMTASRGFTAEALASFRIVRRDTNTTCAVALTRRMCVFVEDISTSYLFVGTPELEALRRAGTAAVQSTPVISSTGRFWGVISAHFRAPRAESTVDQSALNRLARQVADCLEQREGAAESANCDGPTRSR
jgi:GAF domain-containing protein